MPKQDPGVPVTKEAYLTAYERWYQIYPTATFDQSFAHFLGMTRLRSSEVRSGLLMMRKSAVDKIMLLNSPHWYTILKAREARIAGKVKRLRK